MTERAVVIHKQLTGFARLLIESVRKEMEFCFEHPLETPNVSIPYQLMFNLVSSDKPEAITTNGGARGQSDATKVIILFILAIFCAKSLQIHGMITLFGGCLWKNPDSEHHSTIVGTIFPCQICFGLNCKLRS